MRLVLAIAAVLTLAAPAGAATSGLRGTVVRSPATPVCQEGTSCSKPAKNVTITFVRNGVTRSVTTDADGRYSIHLTAGTWAVRLPAGKFGYGPRTALVRAGVVRVQNFTIDTGIR